MCSHLTVQWSLYPLFLDGPFRSFRNTFSSIKRNIFLSSDTRQEILRLQQTEFILPVQGVYFLLKRRSYLSQDSNRLFNIKQCINWTRIVSLSNDDVCSPCESASSNQISWSKSDSYESARGFHNVVDRKFSSPIIYVVQLCMPLSRRCFESSIDTSHGGILFEQ